MTMTLEQAQSPSYNPPAVRGCNPPLGCFGSGPAAPPGKPGKRIPTQDSKANIDRKIGHLRSRLEFTVGWGTNLPGRIIVNIQISFFFKFKPILRNLTNLGILRQAVSGFTFFTFFFSRVHWTPEEIRYELKLSLYLWELSMIFVRVINNICERILVWLPSGPASPRTPVQGKERLVAPDYEGGLKGW